MNSDQNAGPLVLETAASPRNIPKAIRRVGQVNIKQLLSKSTDQCDVYRVWEYTLRMQGAPPQEREYYGNKYEKFVLPLEFTIKNPLIGCSVQVVRDIYFHCKFNYDFVSTNFFFK